MSPTQQTIETELAVIGGGPGGYAAAFHAADKGMSVTLIDAMERPGGVCLHVGCIPSKALLHAAALLDETRAAKKWGIEFGEPKIDLDALRQWKTGIVDKLVGGLQKLCKSRKVKFIQGRAVFIDSERLRLEDSPTEMVLFQNAILATGSSPVIPPGLDIGSARVMDSTAALDLPDVPARLLVVGGGYIGLELATVYAALGSKVTIVEMTDELLPGVDRDLVRLVHARLRRVAEAIHLETKVAAIEETGQGNEAALEVMLQGKAKPARQSFDRALIAVGRRPNTSGIGLENTKIRVDARGFVQVDAQRRTSEERIFAIGDVAGEPMLAHKATREARVAVEAMLGEPVAFDPLAIPAVVFTNPEIAWCGLTETEAKSKAIAVKVARYPWGASGRAVTLDRTDGMTKILCDPETGRVLGMGIVGAGAGELIAEGVLAIEMGAVAEDLASSIHPHPTLTETIMESSEMILGSATHLYQPPGSR
ncbi:dihydrolipoyl dehydrogenase [Candidatus Sumerlaeota bacterium]|nr:dihydrolipoyl dehydrogenase [Candidatus Sumerlaeota bacterium]